MPVRAVLMLKLIGFINVSYALVWLPWWAAIAIVLVVAAAAGPAARYWRRPAQDTSMCHAGYWLPRIGVSWDVAATFAGLRAARGSERAFRLFWLASVGVGGFIVFPLLVQLKLDEAIATPWSAVFVPLWLALPLTCCTQRVCGSCERFPPAVHFQTAICIVLVWPTTSVVALLAALRLDDKAAIPVWGILMP